MKKKKYQQTAEEKTIQKAYALNRRRIARIKPLTALQNEMRLQYDRVNTFHKNLLYMLDHFVFIRRQHAQMMIDLKLYSGFKLRKVKRRTR